MPATTPLYPPDFRASPISPSTRKRRRNPRTVSMPERVGPFARLVFAEMARQRVTYDSLEERSGVRRATLKAWRKKNRPGLESIEAALATLGFGLVPVAALEALDHPELAGELTALALKMRMNIPQTWAALIDIGVEQKLLRMRADERAAILAEHESRLAGIPANDNQKRSRKAA
jgi:transcriptional regulator with XRE-family HTH domain